MSPARETHPDPHRHPLVGTVLFVNVTFFVIALVTSIMGALIPEIIQRFHLSLTAAALLPFSFFMAYGPVSIPAGMLLEARSDRLVLLAGFTVSLVGALAVALHPTYLVALLSLSLIGAGMAALQVCINPLLRIAAGPANYAFHSTVAQITFAAGSFVSPRIYSFLVDDARLTWSSVYWVFVLALAAMGVVTALVALPTRAPSSPLPLGAPRSSWHEHRHLLRSRTVWLYAAAIFLYVACEQGNASWMSQYLRLTHGLDPRTTGAAVVSWYWGSMGIGCLVGLLALRLFDSRRVLVAASLGAATCLLAALLGSAPLAKIAFPLIGFFEAVMWPVIFSLALNSVPEGQGALAGILCTAIVGGAAGPLAIGAIADIWGLGAGLLLLLPAYGYILAVGFWSRPLIKNRSRWGP
jgi:fucose permease